MRSSTITSLVAFRTTVPSRRTRQTQLRHYAASDDDDCSSLSEELTLKLFEFCSMGDEINVKAGASGLTEVLTDSKV